MRPLRLSRCVLAGLILIAACQPLPHPFADDVPPPNSPLLAIPDTISLAIAPVEGKPRAAAIRLAGAVARALQEQHQIAASARTTSIDSEQLVGTIVPQRQRDGTVAVTARWQLRNAKGRLVGSCASRTAAPERAWLAADKRAIRRLATMSADKIALLFLGTGAVAQAAETPQLPSLPTIAIGRISGAPGDGATALKRAIAFILSSRHLANIAAAKAKADLVLAANVAVGRPIEGKEHVAIVWSLHRANGGDIGTVAQQNDVPSGQLDHAWGEIAYLIADAAKSGIMELVAHASTTSGKT